MRRRRNQQQSGFALLFVFAMAAIIAITLYVALPRITFEAQRDKEELLIQRGEQYERSIQLYVRKFKRFPAKMEDLDNTNGIRFLRHHYVDPMTGKDEWRLIHAGPGGVLLDSLVKKQPTDKKFGTQSSITELAGVGALPESDTNVNLALRKRPSDAQSLPGTESSGGVPAGANPSAPIPPDPPQGTLPGAVGGIGNPPNPFLSGQNQAGQNQAGQNLAGTNQPGVNPAGGNFAGATAAGTNLPGRLGGTQNPAGSAVNSQAGGISVATSFGPATPTPTPTLVPGQTPVPPGVTQQIGTPAIGGQGATPNAQGSADAAKLIQGLLTSPRPGGLAGIQGSPVGGQTIGGGIAGVASTIKSGTGIKIYNEQDEYKKWEFVYDPSKEAQAAGAGVRQAAPAPGTPIGQQPAAPGNGVFGPAPGTPQTTPQTLTPK